MLLFQKEEDARRAKKEATERAKREEEARTAESLLPDSEVRSVFVLFVCLMHSPRLARI
jgi:hypothetical protein